MRLPLTVPAWLCIVLPLLDLLWNLTHLNIGLPDFHGLSLPARALALHGAWPQTPYFPVLYPLLLVPFGLLGNVLAGGYILSASGLMLTLFAVRRLVIMLSVGPGRAPAAAVSEIADGGSRGAPRPGLASRFGDTAAGARPGPTSFVILLAWLMPIWRVVAGSPSVDALYTGLGLWFLAAAITVWRGDLRSPRTVVILWLTAFLLPLLRYHALVLVIPVAAVLFFRVRLKSRWTAIAILKSGVAALLLNYLGYMLAYGEALPDVASLQIRCGIEFAQQIHYPTPQALWGDYASFAQHARATPLLVDYTAPQLARHVATNLVMFLRQPAILLALLLCGAMLGARPLGRILMERGPIGPLSQPALPTGAALLCLWLLLYCLSLSAAYYTARAALLPALVGLAVCAVLALRLPRGLWRGALALLLAGYLLGSRFAWQDFNRRKVAAQESRELSALLRYARIPTASLLYLDPLVVIGLDKPGQLATDNPWCEPYPTARGSWLDDPAIPPVLIEGWEYRGSP